MLFLNATLWPLSIRHIFVNVPNTDFVMTHFFRFSFLSQIDGLQHAITTRHNGSSTGFCDSLNLGFHVGDNANNVRENRQIVAQELGFDIAHLTCAQQTHGANCEIVTTENRGRGALDWESAIPETDALITSESETPLMILVADCAPLLFVDETNRVLAVVHAGWRGATSRIASKTVLKMAEVFGTKAEDLRVGVGPTLCVNCFQVGNEVAQIASAIASQSLKNQGEKWYLDMRELLREDLRQVRVLDSQIETMPNCPRCETQTFFSHRGENGKTGRFALVAQWKPTRHTSRRRNEN